MIDGRWVLVLPRVVLDPSKNKDGMSSHICTSKSGYIYCFVGGSPKS